ncbi:hypothetical protein LTR10_021719 [Elasticomyces elasticus]|nr:hypothetical protein LTR10_021719 [Elasticomyces elasticus]
MAKDTIGVQLLITMQTWKITLTAAATLLQLTQASPTPLISRSACTDGEVYNGFTISCATDLAGGDMGVTQTSTLDGCIDTCASTTGCVAISYVAPFCYLKNVAEGTSSSANVIAAMVDSTGPCSSGSTASSYTTGDDTFSVTCGWDYSGYDISNEQTTTFEGCMDACAANSQCYAISYTTGSWCYMKSAGVGGSANANVNVASLPSSSTTTTTTTTSPTTATSSTTTTAAASGLCINDQGGGSSFTSGSKTYTISCGFDYYGYDISLAQTSTFEGCLSACSSNSDCAAVSWTTTGFCYMKNGVSAGDDNALFHDHNHSRNHDHNHYTRYDVIYHNDNLHTIYYYNDHIFISVDYHKHDLIDHINHHHAKYNNSDHYNSFNSVDNHISTYHHVDICVHNYDNNNHHANNHHHHHHGYNNHELNHELNHNCNNDFLHNHRGPHDDHDDRSSGNHHH